jgi:CHAT domain-containing protein
MKNTASLVLYLALALLSFKAIAAESYLDLYKQGRALEAQGNIAAALDHYSRAVVIARREKPEDAAKVLAWQGKVYQQQTQFTQAEAAFNDALETRQTTLGDKHGAVAASLSDLGGLAYAMGEFDTAEKRYRDALAIDAANLGASHWKLAIRLNNLAEVLREKAQYDEAEKLLQRALAIDRAEWGDKHTNVAIRLSNLAELNRQRGEYTKAKHLLEQAIAIDEANFAALEVSALNLGIRYNNLGQLYRTIGAYAKAKPLYDKALALWRQDPGAAHPVSAAGYNNLGWLAYLEKDYVKAGDLYQRALDIITAGYGEHHPDRARNLNNLGLLYVARQQYQQAEQAYLDALDIWYAVHGKQHPNTIITANNLAKLYREMQRNQEAEDVLKQLVVNARQINEPTVLWLVYDNLSRTLAVSGQHGAAALLGKQAVNTLQQLRANLAALDKELQHLFLEQKRDVYQHLADLLIDQGRISEAQQVLVMLKEEEYYDFLRRQDDAARVVRAAYNDTEHVWIEKGAQLEQTLLAQADTRSGDSVAALTAFNQYFEELKAAFQHAEVNAVAASALSGEDKALAKVAEEYQILAAKTKLSGVEQARRDFLRDKLFAASQAINACQDDSGVLAQFQVKNLDTLQMLQSTLRKVGHGAVLLHYLIMPERLRIILTTPDAQLCRDSDISAAALDEAIQNFRRALQNRRKYPIQETRKMYALLIKPIAEALEKAQAKTLMLALDGRLRYIPFAALLDDKTYLIEKYALAQFTTAARETVELPPNNQWRVAALGLSEAVSGFNALPTVIEELDGIVQEDANDDNGVLPGIVKLNQAFNANTLSDIVAQRQYPVIHLASHFVFAPRTDADSYLLLGDGGKLNLATVRHDFEFTGVELLTLSACQTGVGSVGKGQEVEGFGALAQKRGAKSVIATLWPVDDRSTGAFTQHFYRVHQDGLSKAQALQAAQIAYIEARHVAMAISKGELKPEDRIKLYPRHFDHPFYWAPFVLMGNWL